MAQHQQHDGTQRNNVDKHVNKYGKPQVDRENKGFHQIDHEKQNQVTQKEAQNAKGDQETQKNLEPEHRKDPSSFNEEQGRKTSPDPQMNQFPDSDAGSQ